MNDEQNNKATANDIMEELIAQRKDRMAYYSELRERLNSQNFNEAPYSGNVRTRIHGYDWQLTVRAGDSKSFVEKVDGLMKWLDARTDNALNVEPTAPTMAAPQAPIPQPAPAAQNGNGNALTFEVERMEASVNAGKVSWRCKGGHFTQYGVICWPEVLKAANMNLDPTKGTYTFNPPMVAEYALKDDGKPQKVTRLYQKQG